MGHLVSAISAAAQKAEYTIPQVAYIPSEGFDTFAAPGLDLPGFISTFAKCAHITHFAFRRVEQLQELKHDSYAVFIGSALRRVDNLPLIQLAVKVAQLGRVLLEIKDRAQDFHLACKNLLDELWQEFPVPAQFLLEESEENDCTQVIPWYVEVMQTLSKNAQVHLRDFLYRLRLIIKCIKALIHEFIRLSRSLCDLYDSLAYASDSWEYFQLLPNLSELLGRLEKEPVAFSKFVRENQETFTKACELLGLESWSEKILEVLENTTEGVAQAAKGIRGTAAFAHQGLKDVGNVMTNAIPVFPL